MTRFVASFLAASFVTTVPFAPEARAIDAPTPANSASEILSAQPEELIRRLNEKKVVILQEVRERGALSGGLILGYVIFSKPVDLVYRLLAETSRQREYRPEVTSIETVRRDEFGPVDEHHLKILFRRFSYRLVYRLEPEMHRISWRLAEDYENDLRAVEGFWELFPIDEEHTLGRFGTQVDVGPAVPGFLQDWITRKNVPRAMEQVRKWIDSDGSYRP